MAQVWRQMPPIQSRASSTVGLNPWCKRCLQAQRPVIPAPMMHTVLSVGVTIGIFLKHPRICYKFVNNAMQNKYSYGHDWKLAGAIATQKLDRSIVDLLKLLRQLLNFNLSLQNLACEVVKTQTAAAAPQFRFVVTKLAPQSSIVKLLIFQQLQLNPISHCKNYSNSS